MEFTLREIKEAVTDDVKLHPPQIRSSSGQSNCRGGARVGWGWREVGLEDEGDGFDGRAPNHSEDGRAIVDLTGQRNSLSFLV